MSSSTTPTPSSVPSFKPQSKERTLTKAAKNPHRVNQADRPSLSTKAYNVLHESEIEGLSTKFQLVTSTKNNDEQLIGTYTLNIIIKDFICKLKTFDLQNAFTLIQSDPSAMDGSWNTMIATHFNNMCLSNLLRICANGERPQYRKSRVVARISGE